MPRADIATDDLDLSAAALRRARSIVRKAVVRTLQSQDAADARISVTLCSDARMRALNREWLGRDRTTDVIAFPLWEPGEPPVGDVYLGVERARAQAEEHGIPFEQELARIAIHGTLHALGHDHPEGAGRTRSRMWRTQERILAELAG